MSRRCGECGSADIEVDTTRADAVCTNCGAVLESSIIVSDIQFEENAHGGSSAIGTFVSNESKGGKGVGGTFTASIGRESREITLKNARRKIVNLSQQLRLRPDHIDMAFYFFKLALSKHLTRGRKSSHVIAACVYITCRTEGTSHMLIDFSDILQIDVYELGRTYLRLSQALCINIPAMDPCLYVMRFAHRLEFGEKTHEVSMTALRLVSRMKKDWIHFGRRPSGLCGAALLIAGRLHDFSRTINDVIKVVKVHESTLRKRLNEFGETPASQLTLDEFMTADLDAMTEEQDPPSFKAARKKDRERLARLDEEEELEKEVTKLEAQIEKELEERKGKLRGPYAKLAREQRCSSSPENTLSDPSSSPAASDSEDKEDEEAVTARFLEEETLGGILSQCLEKDSSNLTSKEQLDYLLMPPPSGTPARSTSGSSTGSSPRISSPGMGLRNSVEDYLTSSHHQQEKEEKSENEELDLTGIDEDEIDSYIMSDQEIRQKAKLWLRLNKEYLLEQEEKIKREKMEREEMIKAGKDPDKKKKTRKKTVKSNHQTNGSAIEAIEKIVQEKKISTKINYDVLRSLNMSPTKSTETKLQESSESVIAPSTIGEKRPLSITPLPISSLESRKRVKVEEGGTPTAKPRSKPNLTTGGRKAKSAKASDKPIEKRQFNFSAFMGTKSKSASPQPEDKFESRVPSLHSEGQGTKTSPPSDLTTGHTSALSTPSQAAREMETVIEDGSSLNQPDTDEEDEDDDEEVPALETGLSAAELLQQHMGGGGGDGIEEEEYPEEEYY